MDSIDLKPLRRLIIRPFIAFAGYGSSRRPSMAIIDRGVGRTMRDTVSLLLNSAIGGRLVAALN